MVITLPTITLRGLAGSLLMMVGIGGSDVDDSESDSGVVLMRLLSAPSIFLKVLTATIG